MKSNDFVKYLTIQLVERIDNPKQKSKETAKEQTESFSSHWFGLIPFSLKMVMKRLKKNA
ncbi:YqzE family protein [Tepidibacillus infernus]|uniref:YqzE family protein n=1 Tax=Tepidibacillus infernus TaxID=1806172 RepID=UPI003A2313FA